MMTHYEIVLIAVMVAEVVYSAAAFAGISHRQKAMREGVR